jgi:hypothetical protein
LAAEYKDSKYTSLISYGNIKIKLPYKTEYQITIMNIANSMFLLKHHIKFYTKSDIQHIQIRVYTYITTFCECWHFSDTSVFKLVVSNIRGLVRAGKIFRNIGDYQIPKT